MTSNIPKDSEPGEPTAQAQLANTLVEPAGTIKSDTLIADDEGAITSDALLREAARIPSPARRESLPELRKGELLGRYLIDSTLGKGGMGVVYKAEDTKLSRMIALKVLATDGKEQRGRFLREAKSAAAVEHNNIATIHDYGEDEGRVFIAMELVRGRSLDKMLGGARLSVSEATRVAREIARGLATAHTRGIVHRDIKPGNVMISDEGDVKLLDFGLAKRADRDEDAPLVPAHEHFTTAERSVIGTPGYMSPEQVKGERVDARTDVFSFGVMLYEMLTGRRPFGGRSAAEVNIAIVRDEPAPPSRVNPSTPPAIERLVMRCLRKDPSERYADAVQILRELESDQSVAPHLAAPSVGTKPLGSASRGGLLWALVFIGVVAVALLIVGLTMSRSRLAPPTASDASSAGPEFAASAAPPPLLSAQVASEPHHQATVSSSSLLEGSAPGGSTSGVQRSRSPAPSQSAQQRKPPPRPTATEALAPSSKASATPLIPSPAWTF